MRLLTANTGGRKTARFVQTYPLYWRCVPSEARQSVQCRPLKIHAFDKIRVLCSPTRRSPKDWGSPSWGPNNVEITANPGYVKSKWLSIIMSKRFGFTIIHEPQVLVPRGRNTAIWRHCRRKKTDACRKFTSSIRKM